MGTAGAEPSRVGYGLLLGQGSFFIAGLQLANVSVVLSFIVAQKGIVWAAGLLYSAFSIGIIVGTSIAPVVLERARHMTHLVVAATATTMAALIICNAVAARADTVVALIFLSTSMAIGGAVGISNVANSELVCSKLAEPHRGNLVLMRGAIGAVVAIIATLLVVPLLANREPEDGHIDLLWLGAAGLVAAGVSAVLVGPVRSGWRRTESRRVRDIYRNGMVVARSAPWFRRYLVTQLLFVPVILGTMFYSLHAAEQHGDKAASLHTLIIYSSIGLIVGTAFWRVVYRALGIRGMLLISALLSSTSAVICILAEALNEWSKVWVHGVVFLLATVAAQAVFATAILWAGMYAADRDRATLIAFGSVLVAIQSTFLGGVLGFLAHYTEAIWPVTIVLTLNLLAAGAAAWAPRAVHQSGRAFSTTDPDGTGSPLGGVADELPADLDLYLSGDRQPLVIGPPPPNPK